MMQELYLLDTCTSDLQQVARSTEFVTQVTSSKDSTMFLVLWESCHTDNQRFDVYECTGNHLASFWDPRACLDPPATLLIGNRAAILSSTTIGLWNLENGQLQKTVTPGIILDAIQSRRGIMATNTTCSKLVVLPSRSSTLYLYDAVGLELISTFLSDFDCRPQFCTSEVNRTEPPWIWGPYGWVISHSILAPVHGQIKNVTFEQLLPQAESTRYSMVSLQQTGNLLARLDASSLSPCGAYICRYDKCTAEVQINDVRSGEIMLRRSLGQAAGNCCMPVICWSGCGCRLMVLVISHGLKTPFFGEQLFTLQFC